MKTDLEIQRDVMDELKWDPTLSASEIGVAVKTGVVMLTGYVTTYSKKLAAEQAAKRVKDVRAVAEEIEVRLPTSGGRTDAELADAAANALQWNTKVPDEGIHISVEKGWITLDGEVEWQFQKDAAMEALNYLVCTTGITNSIHIKSKGIPSFTIKDAIKDALKRSAEVEASGIIVETMDNKVILKGNVRSWTEKREAEKAAWRAPGVTNVKDELLII